MALIGALFYAVLLRHMQRQSPMRQVLVTFGLIFVGFDAVRMIWGVLPHTIPIPEVLDGRVIVLGEVYPAYRLFIIGVGLAVLAALHFGLERTRLGAIVRAGVDDRTMVAALGINVERAFFIVFCVGCWLAGLAGVVSAPVFSIFPGMDMSILILTLIVVVVGGPGSLKGALNRLARHRDGRHLRTGGGAGVRAGHHLRPDGRGAAGAAVRVVPRAPGPLIRCPTATPCTCSSPSR